MTLAGDAASPALGQIGYLLGQYVYLLDAIDDYDSDRKKKQYNALYLTYHSESRQQLLADHLPSLQFILNAIYDGIRTAYQQLPVFQTEGIITNTLWYGLQARAHTILDKENHTCHKTHIKF